MTQPEQPEGLGTPTPGQPGFTPPPGSGLAPPPGPGLAQPAPATPPFHAAPAWVPPDPGARVASPPTGRVPQPRRPGRRALVAAVLAGGLLLVGLLSALPMLPSAAPTTAPPAPSAGPVVVTVSPSAVPSAASTLSSGGAVGQAVPFSGPKGEGTLTVVGATWTDTGQAAPIEGERYLVVTLAISCTGGTVPVDPILFLASTDTATVLPGFGPELTRPLGGRLLAAGDDVTGQVGFALPAGPVDLMLLDEDLHPLASVRIPAP